ncbi:MAG: DEAD/DEAH box helicase [Candidatus Omnitrophica bacterium]|nr:DEAD/DEAH box helicase [Candidatus Omnitrophota bacterium]
MSEFRLNSKVRLKTERDRIGIIESGPKKLAGDNWYRIRFLNGEAQNVEASNLELFEGTKDVLDLFYENCYSKKETFSKLITYSELHKPLHNYLYSFRSSRTEFYAYQFKPLIKFLDSPQQRLLIADEVGLGKTIEAGFILNELKARHSLGRVLIVCPSALSFKWKEEMERRFSEEFQILNSGGFRDFLNRFAEYGEIIKLRAICSLQTLRSRSIFEHLQNVPVPFDLIIIDEAHHMRNTGTLSYRLGEFLSNYSDAMVMMTATPIHLGNENLFNLLRILDSENFGNITIFDERLKANEHIIAAGRIIRSGSPPDFDSSLAALRGVEKTPEKEYFLSNPIYQDLMDKLNTYDKGNLEDVIELQGKIENLNLMGNILTRTRKVDVFEKRALRTPRVVRPQFTAAEKKFYDEVTDFIISKNIVNKKHPIYVFQTIMIQRQMASCIPAAVEHIKKKYALDQYQYREDLQEESDLNLEDLGDDIDKDGKQFDMSGLVQSIKELIDVSDSAMKVDSKFDALTELLNRLNREEPNSKIIVFSYFKKTLTYLEKRLRNLGYKCVLISGDVPSVPTNPIKDERKRRLDQFKNDTSFRIMLSTEVGSEGLDFQFCHILINYDLPWNPMVVEQRIGRLDRIGQKSEKILIYNFSIPGTIEERMLNRLYERIRIFKESIGDLEAILGEEMQKLTWEFFTTRLTPKEQESRIIQSAKVIEGKRQELLSLEKNSLKLIGEDTYFSDSIERKRKDKLYLSPEEIEVFVKEFIDMEFPKSSIKDTINDKGCRMFKVCQELENFIRSKYSRDDSLLQQFLIKIYNGELIITFDSDVAYEKQDVEFLNFYHPIVKAIVKHYEEHQEKLHPVARMCLKSNKYEKGQYFYFIFLVEMTSMKSSRDFEPVFVSKNLGKVLPREISWEMFVKLITEASTMESEPIFERGYLERVYKTAEHEFSERIKSKREKMKKINEDIANNRLESIKRSYDVKISKKDEMLQKAIEKQTDQRIMRMHEGAKRNLESAFKSKISEIEEKKRLGIKYDLIAAGTVEVN